MINNKLKNIFIWIIILLLSITLIASNFNINTKQHQKNDDKIIKLKKYNINKIDIKKITNNTRQEF